MMRKILCVAAAFLAVPLAYAGAPAPAWTAKGFSQPESVLYVAQENAIFVSNLSGDPAARDGNGFISRLKPDGTVEKLEWLKALNAPKGMAYAQGRLFVADIDRVLEIDVRSAAVAKTYVAKGAKFLNDVALEPRSHFKGQTARVYISDMADNSIWYLADSALELLVRDKAFDSPNGLLVEGDNLRIASLGSFGADGSPGAAGRLKTMKLDDDQLSDRFGPEPLGNLDGLEADGQGGYWVSDWPAGRIYRVDASGTPNVWLQLEQGTADIGIVPGKLLLVPMMKNNEVRAYALPK